MRVRNVADSVSQLQLRYSTMWQTDFVISRRTLFETTQQGEEMK